MYKRVETNLLKVLWVLNPLLKYVNPMQDFSWKMRSSFQTLTLNCIRKIFLLAVLTQSFIAANARSVQHFISIFSVCYFASDIIFPYQRSIWNGSLEILAPVSWRSYWWSLLFDCFSQNQLVKFKCLNVAICLTVLSLPLVHECSSQTIELGLCLAHNKFLVV